jgi:hypothetical protein
LAGTALRADAKPPGQVVESLDRLKKKRFGKIAEGEMRT